MRTAAALLVLSLAGCGTPPAAETVVLLGTVRYPEPMPKPRESLVVNEAGGVRWAFVYITKGAAGRAYDGPPLRMEMSGLRFQPHVVGVRVGQTLEIHNRDQGGHHVHPVSDRRVMSHDHRDPWTTRFNHTDVMVRLKCDIHPWMSAWVGVLDHPYFAVTDAQGKFEIRDLPPGIYTLAVWHESLQPEEREIPVTDNATLDFTLKGR